MFGSCGVVWYLPGMRDADVRRVLRRQLDACYAADPNTLIVEELGLCRGSVRADLAVINGVLKGYEIKSDRDRLIRLGAQAETYNKVFDTVTIVVADRHLNSVERMVPDWWGIDTVTPSADSSLLMLRVREEGHNHRVEPAALVQLLWRGEVLLLLRRSSSSTNFEHKPREFLWRTLVESVPLLELKAQVRECLRNRKLWRVPGEHRTDDVRFPPFATWSGSLYRLGGSRSRRYIHRPS